MEDDLPKKDERRPKNKKMENDLKKTYKKNGRWTTTKMEDDKEKKKEKMEDWAGILYTICLIFMKQ
jgi:hypothetical protein